MNPQEIVLVLCIIIILTVWRITFIYRSRFSREALALMAADTLLLIGLLFALRFQFT